MDNKGFFYKIEITIIKLLFKKCIQLITKLLEKIQFLIILLIMLEQEQFLSKLLLIFILVKILKIYFSKIEILITNANGYDNKL